MQLKMLLLAPFLQISVKILTPTPTPTAMLERAVLIGTGLVLIGTVLVFPPPPKMIKMGTNGVNMHDR